MKKIFTSQYRLNWYKIVLFSVAIVLTGTYSITVKGQAVVPLTVNATVNAADKQSDAVTAITANTGTSSYKQSNGDPLYRNSGYTDVFSLTSTTANLQNEETTLNAAGLITSMSIYHNGGTGKVVMGIYSDGIYHTADQLLGETAPTTINPYAGWQTIQLKNPVLITSELSSTVFMAWVFEDNPGIRYKTGPGSVESPITWRESLPETFGVGNSAALNYSVYCTYKPTDSANTLYVSRENISLKVNSGSEGTVYITSNTNWSVNEDASWLEVSPASGSNSVTITFTANSFNSGFSPRTATVTISGTGVADKTLTVTQEYMGSVSLGDMEVYDLTSKSEYLTAQPLTFFEAGELDEICIYHNGGTGKVLLGVYSDQDNSPSSLLGVSIPTSIYSSEGWQWISLKNPVKVNLGQTVWLSWIFENNPGVRYTTSAPLTAKSTSKWTDGMPSTFGITAIEDFKYTIFCDYKQVVKTLNLSETNVSMGYGPLSSATVNITSNTNWSISNDASWLDVSPASGSNNRAITLTVNSENRGTSRRIAHLKFSGIGVRDTNVIVTQEYLELGASNVGVDEVYSLKSSTSYRLAESLTFSDMNEFIKSTTIKSITIYHEGGTGNVLLGVYSDQDGSPLSLLGVTAPTTINKTAGWQTVSLISPVLVDKGQTIWLSWVFEDNPGIRYVPISLSIAESMETWSGGMPTTFGNSTFAGSLYSIYCTYINEWYDFTFSISTDKMSIGSDSQSKGTFDITSNSSWSITTNVSWLDVSQTSGSYKGTITLTANSANTGTSPRTAIVNISGAQILGKNLTVTQEFQADSTKNLGNITYQVWNNIGSSTKVNSLTGNVNYPNNPTSSTLIPSMEGTTNLGDSYGARIVGYICAPAIGIYIFWIASDDYGELWLSTNDDPANKHKIAYVNGYTQKREWNKYVTQKSVAINLVQGQKYYIEALMKEGTGKDNLAVGWLKPGETGSVPSEIIPGSVLSPSAIIPVSSVILPPALELNTGASILLPATVIPDNATVKTLIWTASDPTIAIVNSNGIVTGISPGRTTITATSTDGSYKSENCMLTVSGVPSICSATGNINYQVWNNIGSGLTVSSLTSNLNYPDNPTSSTLITSMEATNDHGDNYGARIIGYICAPATGSYTFWIASDDYGELWLSTNDDPANKYKIAYVNGYTWIKEWNKYPSQKSVTINLFKGQKYYIEALMKEATGKDNLAVGWLIPGETGSLPSEVIPGSVLSPFGTIPVNSVTLPPTLDLNTGASVLLQATVLPVNATEKIINLTTNDPRVALVNSNGIVTAISTGNATITATSTDGSNKTATCVVTVAGVPTICSATGNITYQVWNNIGSSPLVSSLTGNANYPDNPTSGILINSMEGSKNLADNYGARIVGYICAPATGSYTFWIASDDYGELWISTNDEPINKHKIAYVNGYTWIRDWNKYPTQKSVSINLVQGQKYYIEALMKEATGHDNLVVGWLKPGETGTVPSEVIPGSVLSPLILNGKTAEAKGQINVKSKLDVTLLVYPNPLNDNLLNIKLENIDSEATIRIFNISGVKCYEGIIQGSGIVQVDRSVFKSGMFLIKVENDFFIKTTKLIVN